MNKVLVIQSACGSAESQLKMTESWHRSCIEASGAEYRCNYERLVWHRGAMWDKVVLIIDALKAGREIVVWIDADCVLQGPIDFADALPDGADIAMVRNGQNQFNSGLMIIRNSPKILRTWEYIERDGPLAPYPGDQHRINSYLSGLKVNELDSAWNWYDNAKRPPVGQVKIRSFHNKKEKAWHIKKEMERIENEKSELGQPVQPTDDATGSGTGMGP